MFSSGLISVLSEKDQFEITAISNALKELLPELKTGSPDVLLVDILHCDNGGIQLLRKIMRAVPDLPVILLTSMQYSDCFTDHVKLGVKGFVFENETPEDLKEAIRKVLAGSNYLPKEMQKWLKEISPSGKQNSNVLRKKNTLTDREISILKLFCQGLTYKEIGERLFISPRTVETHKKNILTKLRLKSTAEMVKYAFHNRLII
ncbi:response regulator transcription factor [Mangrovibacterium lignilyticum]|uniref:response regulator transcription factor n=1 Tax=Mangrovibacterium lignilyticum TaxID=2668052 RepID=UPI0013D1FA74|nr:response regulator transcription factor [Mangrovibacterium lignilyticum]